jgi:uncharacterized lipoprotein YddW (UPF0748 family)
LRRLIRRLPRRVTRPLAGLALAGFTLASVRAAQTDNPAAPPAAREEVRALWVVRTSLTSPAAIDDMVTAAKAGGFNTLLVQIRGRGDAYYLGSTEPRPSALVSQPTLDPLARTISAAHGAGLAVHAWMTVNLVAGTDLPVARNHVVYRHPEWLMVPRSLGEDFATLDPTGPEYLGRLVRHARNQPGELEGLYLSPVTQGSVDYTAAVVRDIVTRYAVDGVHFEHVRYPNDEFDYSRETLAAFRRVVVPGLSDSERRRYEARAESEPLLYTIVFPDRWRAFRAERLTNLLTQLRDTVRSVRPGAVVSAAVAADPVEAAGRRLEDWPMWLARDLIDIVCPMANDADSAAFASQIAMAREAAGRHPLWVGIGAARLSHEQIVDDIRTARRIGAGGVVLFSYDSLVAPARGSGYLNQLGKAAFGNQF